MSRLNSTFWKKIVWSRLKKDRGWSGLTRFVKKKWVEPAQIPHWWLSCNKLFSLSRDYRRNGLSAWLGMSEAKALVASAFAMYAEERYIEAGRVLELDLAGSKFQMSVRFVGEHCCGMKECKRCGVFRKCSWFRVHRRRRTRRRRYANEGSPMYLRCC